MNILAKILFAILGCLVEVFSGTVMVSFNKPCSGIAQILTQWDWINKVLNSLKHKALCEMLSIREFTYMVQLDRGKKILIRVSLSGHLPLRKRFTLLWLQLFKKREEINLCSLEWTELGVKILNPLAFWYVKSILTVL